MKDYRKIFDLKGKNVFITGGNGLIGAEVSKAFARCGAKTIALDIKPPKGRRQDRRIIDEYFDITDLDTISNRMKDLVRKYRRIDVWVNIAYPRTKDWGNKVEAVTLESWTTNVQNQMVGYAWSAQQACLLMKKQGGSVINFGSTYGIVAPDFRIYGKTPMTCPIAYSAIKGGIVNLTRYLAAYFGPYHIRVNCVSPGGVFDQQDKGFVERYCDKTPLGRMANPADIAGAVLFLASDAAQYVSGQNLVVDGGFSVV